MTPEPTSGSRTEWGLPETADDPPWALVTGGSRGIGRAVVLDLAERGWNVALGFLRNEEAAEEVASTVRALGREALLCPYNLVKVDETRELMARLGDVTDRLAGLVHAAGLGAPAPAVGARPARWRMAWDTHVGAPPRCESSRSSTPRFTWHWSLPSEGPEHMPKRHFASAPFK